MFPTSQETGCMTGVYSTVQPPVFREGETFCPEDQEDDRSPQPSALGPFSMEPEEESCNQAHRRQLKYSDISSDLSLV